MTARRKPKADAAASTRDRILEASEHLFAQHGYDATSLRDIAIQAETRIGMISYHFETKEALYETIIQRRSAEIGRIRLDMLSSHKKKNPTGAIPVRDIIHAYTWPFLDFSHNKGPGWKSYSKIISNVANSPRWTRLISAYYDPIVMVFLSEFRRAIPGGSEEDLVAGFTFMVSVMLGIAAETGRADHLSEGQLQSTDIDRLFSVMLPFLEAGFLSLGRKGRAAD